MKRIIILIDLWILAILAIPAAAQMSKELYDYNPFTQETTTNPHPGTNRRYIDLDSDGNEYPNPFRLFDDDETNDDPYISNLNNNKPKDKNWFTRVWKDEDGNCLIKGNVSYKSGQKIYHIPGWKDYEDTVIDTEYGEQWFCTEQEAYEAGWRAPYYIKRFYPKTK